MQRVGLLVTLLALGCGGPGLPETAPVTGTVTVDGEPLAKGGIVFLPEFGRMGQGKIVEGEIVGVHTFGDEDGVIVGNTRIGVQPAVIQGAQRGAPEDMGRRARPGEPGFVPPRYVSAQSSGLSATIESGTNELEFNLTTR